MELNEIFLTCFFVLIIGACIGSFLNVVALRAISHESIIFPASKCPACGEHIKWYDNIPVISYFFTFKGKCRNCGCKVSIQYPIVEAVTAILFLVVFIAYGITLKTLFLLILLSLAIVLTITDIKKEYLFDRHLWTFIIISILYSIFVKYGAENIFKVCAGVLTGVIVMEIIAKLSYYLVRKNNDKQKNDEQSNTNSNETGEQTQAGSSDETTPEESEKSEEENLDINEYVKKNKRAFGEGDTYLAAGCGAIVGAKMILPSIILAIIIQAVCILPQFIYKLYKDKQTKLLVSLASFIILTVIYLTILNLITLNIYVRFGFVIALIYFAIDIIQRLKNVVNNEGFVAIPFGPALLFSTFLVLFFGSKIVNLIKYHIFI